MNTPSVLSEEDVTYAKNLTMANHFMNAVTIVYTLVFSIIYLSFIEGNRAYFPYSVAISDLSFHAIFIVIQLLIVLAMSRTKVREYNPGDTDKDKEITNGIKQHFHDITNKGDPAEPVPRGEATFRSTNLWIKILTHLLVFMVHQIFQQGWLHRYGAYVPNKGIGVHGKDGPNPGTDEYYPYLLVASTYIFFGIVLVIALIVDSALYLGKVYNTKEIKKSRVFVGNSWYAICGYIHYVFAIAGSLMCFLSFQGVQQDNNVTSIFVLGGLGAIAFAIQYVLYFINKSDENDRQAFRKARYYALKQFVFFIFYYTTMAILAMYTFSTADDVYKNGAIPKFDNTLPHQHSYFYVWNVFSIMFGSSLIVLVAGGFVHVYSCTTNNSSHENEPLTSTAKKELVGLLYYFTTYEYLFILAQQTFALIIFAFTLVELWNEKYMSLRIQDFAIAFTVIEVTFCVVFIVFLMLMFKNGKTYGIFKHEFIVHALAVVYVLTYTAMGMTAFWHIYYAFNHVMGTVADNPNLHDPTMKVSVFYPSSIVMLCYISVVWILSVIETLSGGNYFVALRLEVTQAKEK